MPIEQRAHPGLQLLRSTGGAEAEVEVDVDAAGDDVAGTGAAVDVRDLPGGRWKAGVAGIPDGLRQFGDRRRCQMDRVFRQLRVGDVALNAFDGQLPDSEPRRPFLIMSPSA
jgi:hypothetical protein